MIRRSTIRDRRGRLWTISAVPVDEVEDEDFRFWYEELTPAERVDLVDDCLVSCLKTKGLDGAPRLRRVHRRVQRPWR
jgi:hypothetical protein